MSDLIEFLKARLAEDEAVAKAAIELAPLPWQKFYGEDGDARWLDIRGDEGTSVVETESGANGPALPVAEHLAHHNPARVLREVEAKRQMMAVHRPYHPDPDQACLGCAGGIEWERCPVLRSLASVYAEHPDYQEAWRT